MIHLTLAQDAVAAGNGIPRGEGRAIPLKGFAIAKSSTFYLRHSECGLEAMDIAI
jgi:hypothetical protein